MMKVLSNSKVELLGKTADELVELVAELGEKPFRARQLYDAIYRRRLTSFAAMTDLPAPLREQLAARAVVTHTRIKNIFTSSDGTRRFLLELGDGREVEAVFMPEERRDTICISSQVGCPLACDFCMTGVLGLKRNMTAGEIVSQIVVVLNEVYGEGAHPAKENGITKVGSSISGREKVREPRDERHPLNVVMMGMGEPLLNYDAALRAVRLFADEKGLAIPPRRVTLSTAGIVPRIDELAKEAVRPRLAISLTAANDELRNRLFPINRKYPLADLMAACRRFPLAERERLTFEYVLLDGVNDSDRDARDLVRLLNGVRAKVNLIPHNPAPELPYRATPMARILAFQKILTNADVRSFIRRPRGQDIAAACGQLAARHEASA
ncbi:MAG TPA: 23S rRNA (adenine(2503)-C(2))-methyltransferase RlmN [Blastocatellia bacterium]|nr:23S rRNA (adenine(2503)-C(2))-methyltransferase RlmN [Blastocatellia bacterium]